MYQQKNPKQKKTPNPQNPAAKSVLPFQHSASRY